MKYFILIIITFLASCAMTEKNIRPGGSVKINENTYKIAYSAVQARMPTTIPDILYKSANLTLKEGYEKFLFYRDDSPSDFLVITIWMFNPQDNIPWDLITYEAFDAKEYSEKRYIPLGLHPGAS